MAGPGLEPGTESFAPAGGRISGGIGIAVVALLVVIDLVDLGSIPFPVITLALFLAVLMWATMLRPRLSAAHGFLVLRNAFSTVRVPLAAIEDVAVRQVLAIRTAQRRYVCPGVGRTVRQAIRSRPTDEPGEATRPALGPAFGGDSPSQIDAGIAYADWVELRVRDLIEEDRQTRRIRAYSDEAEALGRQVEREHAWPEVAAVALTGLLFAAALIAHYL